MIELLQHLFGCCPDHGMHITIFQLIGGGFFYSASITYAIKLIAFRKRGK